MTYNANDGHGDYCDESHTDTNTMLVMSNNADDEDVGGGGGVVDRHLASKVTGAKLVPTSVQDCQGCSVHYSLYSYHFTPHHLYHCHRYRYHH